MRFGKYAAYINGFEMVLVVPLVNVLFLAFITVVLCLGYMSAGSGLKVSLPNVITSQVLDQPAVHITVTADGTFMLNGRKLALGDVALFLKQLSGRRQTVVVDADKHAPLQAVISIFDAVRASGAGECVVAGLP